MASEQPGGLPVADPSLYMVCRMCTRMAEQADRDVAQCLLDCGGPRKGKAYPLYAGPLPESWRRSNCVVCGDPAQRRIEVHGQGEVGACLKHIGLLLPPDVVVQDETESGIVTSTRRRIVSLYEVLGIDPVGELGFKPEELDPADQDAGNLRPEGG